MLGIALYLRWVSLGNTQSSLRSKQIWWFLNIREANTHEDAPWRRTFFGFGNWGMHSCVSLLQREYLDGDHLSSLSLFVRKTSFTEHAWFRCNCVSSGFVSVSTRRCQSGGLCPWTGCDKDKSRPHLLLPSVTRALDSKSKPFIHSTHIYWGYTVWFQALWKWLWTK